MAWPLSQDFNEAIQNPSSAFTDADLKGGTVTTTPLGVPLPRSGNYADVYQIVGPDGRSWALKCFTRAVAPDLKDRYAAIAKHLAEVNLPFNVGFEFLPDGIRVKGKSYPAVKMQWVEGQAINTFVKENLNKATVLEAMLSLWVRLCRRLRETGMAHADLQHGNVILVPAEAGKLGLKLVDYDGMFVPALAGKPTGEAGHASYQHPERILTNNYSADLDRFPHLVVATALRGLLVGGKAMWDKYDTGDNLLFTAKDFTNPAQSKAMREVWDTGDPFAVGLLSHLVIACSKPLAQTPWLDTLMPEGRPPLLIPSQERQAMQLLGIPVQVSVPQGPPMAPQTMRPPQPGAAWAPPAPPRPPSQGPGQGTKPMPAHVAPDLGFEPGNTRPTQKKASGAGLYGAIAAGVLAAIGIGVGIFAFSGKKKDDGNVNTNNPASSTPAPIDPIPKTPIDPKPKPVEVIEPKPPVEPIVKVPDNGSKVGKLNWQATAAWGARPTYSLNGAHLLVPTTNGSIVVLETEKGTTASTFREFTAPKQPLVVPQPAGVALTLDAEATFIPFSTATAKVAGKILTKGLTGTVTKLQTDRTGRLVLDGTATKFEVIDLDDNKAVLTGDASDVLLSSDGTNVLTLSANGELTLIPLDGEKKTTITPADGVKALEMLDYSAAVNLAALRSKAGGVVIVNTETGAIAKKFDETPGVCDFSTDGDRFAIATETGVDFYTTADWLPAGKMTTSAARVAKHIFFSPGGSAICCCGANQIHEFSVPGVVAVAKVPTDGNPANPADIKAGKVLWARNMGATTPVAVHYSRDGSKLIVPMAKSGRMRMYDATSGSPLTVVGNELAERVVAAALPGGKIISKSSGPDYLIWNDTADVVLDRIPVSRPMSKVVKLQADLAGRYVLATSVNSALLLDVEAKKEVMFINLGGSTSKLGASGFSGAALSSDGKQVLVVSTDSKIKIVAIPSGTESIVPFTLPGTECVIQDWNAEKNIAILHLGKSINAVIDTSTGAKLCQFNNAFSHDRSIFTANGQYVVATSRTTKTIDFYDARTGKLAGQVKTEIPLYTQALASSPDSDTVAFVTISSGKDQVVVVASPFGTRSTEVVKTPTPPEVKSDALTAVLKVMGPSETTMAGPIKDAVVDADYKRLAVTDGKLIRVVNFTAKGGELYRIPQAVGTVVNKLWFTQANTLVAALQRGPVQELHVFSAVTGKPERVLDGGSRDLVTSFAVSSAGTHAAAARVTGEVTLFDLATGKTLGTIHPHSGKDPAPDNKLVSVFLGNPCTKILVARADRAQVYTINDLIHYKYFPPGGPCVVEDVTDDMEWVAYRKPSPTGPAKTRFSIKHLGDQWDTSKVVIDVSSSPDNETRFRFLGNDGTRGITVWGATLQLHDTTTGAPLYASFDYGVHIQTANPTPGRKAFTLCGSYQTTLYAPKNFDMIGVVKAPMTGVGIPGRKPIPDDEALKKSETNIRELYKDLFAKKLPSDRRKLAETLLRTGTETKNDAVAKYWLLWETQVLAIELADSQMGARAIDWLESEYDVDGLALRIAMLEKIASVTAKTEVLKNVADTCSEMVEDLAEKGEFDKAIKLGSVAIAALTRANLQGTQQGRDLEMRQSQIRKQKDAFEPVKVALEVLKTKADDAAANLTLGKYRCFVQGNWTEGLTNLGAGNDEGLKKAAALDIGGAVAASKKAEAWWDYAQTQPEAERSGPLGRARYWYAKVITDGAAGLDKVTAENRLFFNSGGIDLKAGLVLELIPTGKVLGAKKTLKLSSTAEVSAAEYKQILNGTDMGVKLNGYLVPPTAGRYKIMIEGRSKSLMKLFAKPDEKTLIDIRDPDSVTAKRDCIVVLPNKPVPFYMEAKLALQATTAQSFTVKWIRPGSKTEEPIPPDAFYHKKTDELTLTEK